uniref:Uncharacterized protein n=1 Tax=Oryza nivara TaxID=4536 RepID=A0A0E0HCK9_ORYNI
MGAQGEAAGAQGDAAGAAAVGARGDAASDAAAGNKMRNKQTKSNPTHTKKYIFSPLLLSQLTSKTSQEHGKQWRHLFTYIGKQAKNMANIGKQWHPLHELDPEVVERDGHLHRRVWQVLVAVPQQHHLVVVREVAIRHNDRRRPHDGVDEPIGAPRQRAVVHPHVARRVERDAVAVGAGAPPVVRRQGVHIRVAGGDTIVDVDVVDDDVGDVLERDARAAGAGAVTRRRSRSLLATSWNPEGVCSWWSD